MGPRLEQNPWRVGLGPRDYGAGACPLVPGAGSWGLRSSACTLVYGARSWALWCAGPCPGVAMGSGVLKAACLLMSRAVSFPS